jgi:hypothetical protein
VEVALTSGSFRLRKEGILAQAPALEHFSSSRKEMGTARVCQFSSPKETHGDTHLQKGFTRQSLESSQRHFLELLLGMPQDAPLHCIATSYENLGLRCTDINSASREGNFEL